MPHQRSAKSSERVPNARFEGFALPTSNTTYCPNQFFDVCLPHRSRGCVRIVAYLLRKTLGWCDAEGKPQRERFTITYRELEQNAGVSRDMIRSALRESVEYGFVRCLQRPKPKATGATAVSGLYELRWDESGAYVKDPQEFHGFFAGEGNRTYIPNQFFDHVVHSESLAVIKVVGAVIRFSIGFQTKWGHRRQQVALSHEHFQRYSHIASRQTLTTAIAAAVKKNYIQRVENGYFDPDGGKFSRATVYALRWLNQAAEFTIGRKNVPANIERENRSEIRTGIGQKSVPADRSENRTGLEITSTNNNLKQSDAATAASFEKLTEAGFDASSARQLASRYPIQRILNQIEWLSLRRANRNRLGLLRRAIEEDWTRPQGRGQLGAPNFSAPDPLAKQKAEVERRLRSPFHSSSES